jgi:hypothetical protein
MDTKTTRTLLLSLVLLAGPDDCLGPGGEPSAQQEQERAPAPDDKRVNEGALGRRNATESQARSAESPAPMGERRP